MDRHLASLRDNKADRHHGIWKGAILGHQVLPQLLLGADSRLSESASGSDEVRGNELVKGLPVLPVDGGDEDSDEFFVGVREKNIGREGNRLNLAPPQNPFGSLSRVSDVWFSQTID